MPTLIRVLGNSDKNAVEVSNTFKEPIIIPAHARVALTGMNAVLVDDLATERFIISGSYGQFQIGIPVDTNGTLPSAVIPTGNYSTSSFVDAMETAANFTGSLANYETLLGLHHEIDMDATDGWKLQVKTFFSDPNVPGFDNAVYWIRREDGLYKPPASASANGFTATGTAGSFTQLVNTERVPLVSSLIQSTFVNGNTVDMSLTATSMTDEDTVFWGVRTNAGAYEYGITDAGATFWGEITEATVPVLAAAYDVVKVYRFAGTIIINITSSIGALKANFVLNDVVTREQVDTSKNIVVYSVKSAATGIMSNALVTAIDGTNPPITYGLNDTVNAKLWFLSLNGGFNSVLASYAGFLGERNVISYKGDPATLKSRNPVKGLPGAPGVLVTIDGLGLLRSFDGAAIAKSPANIIYSVNELNTESQYLSLNVPELLYLDIGNPYPISVNQLRVRLFEAGGYNPLSFIGNPSFSFIIDYP